MRSFSDNTEVPLAWTRVTAENYPYVVRFPETQAQLKQDQAMPWYTNGNFCHIAAHQAVVQYRDLRFDQNRDVKLIMGVCIE